MMKSTQVYATLSKVEDNDDGTITVTGVASTGNPDNEGETVTPSAMENALPDYMLFGAVREMHQANVAAGTALSARVDDEGVTHLSALIVDDAAIKKVKTGVYKGFSVGGKVLERDPLDKTVITAIKLTEVSLVDRPCNPEAVINMWKVDMSDKTAAGNGPVSEEGAVDALAELINKGEVSPQQLIDLYKASKAAPAAVEGTEDDVFAKKDYSDDERKTMADSGEAMPDGSFPIKNKKDLSNAVKLASQAKDEAAAKKHIKSRAKALDAEDSLPDDWKKADTDAAIAAADDKGTPDAAEKVAKAAGAGGKVQNDSGVADIPNAVMPMLEVPKIGDLANFTFGDANAKGKIVEITGSMVKIGAAGDGAVDTGPFVSVDSSKLTYGDVGGGVNGWTVNSETKEVAVSKGATTEDLAKGMWTVADFARLLQEVLYLQGSVQWEQDSEKDGSKMAEQIAAWGKQGAQLLLAYVTEEAKEMFSGIDDPDDVQSVIVELAAKSTKLGKADADRWAVMAKGSDDLKKVGARHSKGDMEHMQTAHDALCKLGVACSKDNIAKEDDDMTEVSKALQAGDLNKAATLIRHEAQADVEALIKSAVDGVSLKMSTQLKKVMTENEDLRKSVDALKKQPAADVAGKTPVMRVINKTDDNGTAEDPLHKAEVEPVKTATGEVDAAATALKKSQQSGGIQLTHNGAAAFGSGLSH